MLINKNQLILPIFIFVTFCFNLCHCNNKDVIVDELKKNEVKIIPAINDTEKEQKITPRDSILNFYHAQDIFEIYRYKYTYDFRNLLTKNNKFLISKCVISDIDKNGSNFTLRLVKNRFHIYLNCTKSQAENWFLKYLNTNIKDRQSIDSPENFTYLLIKIIDCKRIKLNINSSPREEEDASSQIEIVASDSFIIKAELIEKYPLAVTEKNQKFRKVMLEPKTE